MYFLNEAAFINEKRMWLRWTVAIQNPRLSRYRPEFDSRVVRVKKSTLVKVKDGSLV